MTKRKFSALVAATIALATGWLGMTDQAQAQRRGESTSYESPTSSGKHVLTPAIGFFGSGPATLTYRVGNNASESAAINNLSGIFGIGGDYEYMVKSDLGIGGMFRYYATEDSVASSTYKTSTVLLGPIARAYLINTQSWLGAVTTGLTTINMSYKETNGGSTSDWNPSMHFGWIMGWSVFYKFNSQMALGIENMRVLAVGDKINGWAVDDFMFKFRIAL